MCHSNWGRQEQARMINSGSAPLLAGVKETFAFRDVAGDASTLPFAV